MNLSNTMPDFCGDTFKTLIKKKISKILIKDTENDQHK